MLTDLVHKVAPAKASARNCLQRRNSWNDESAQSNITSEKSAYENFKPFGKRRKLSGLLLILVIGWFGLMLTYLFIKDTFEHRAVPVTVTPFKNYGELQDGYIAIAGSFASDSSAPNDQLPLETSKITCIREQAICRIATAKIIFNELVMVDDDTLKIQTWSPELVIFVDDAPICVHLVYTINRMSKAVNITSLQNQNATDKECQSSSKIKSFSLRTGWDVYLNELELYRRRTALYFHFLLATMNAGYIYFIIVLIKRKKV